MKREDVEGENYIMRNFTNCDLHKMFYDNEMREDDMDGAAAITR
jgi:hypothetical protein